MTDSPEREPAADDPPVDRRGFISASSAAMTGGLVAGYGAFFVMAGRYLYPSNNSNKAWMFVAQRDEMRPGDALEFETPTGVKIVVARQGDTGTIDDFIALSSTCPHLGCRVDWQPQNQRFFCPCHNGAFDPQGKATMGPPAQAGQSLPEYPLMLSGKDETLLFIEVPTESVVDPWRRDTPLAQATPHPGPPVKREEA